MTKHPFEYQAPSPEATNKIITVRIACAKLYECITWNIADSRERAIAITKLEEVSMWANKAIVFAPEVEEPKHVQ